MNTSVEAKKFPRQKKGFTIIELLVVIAIIGVLAAISFVTYKGIKARADAAATMAMGTQIAKKLALHNEEEGHYPTKNDWDDGSWDDSFGDGWDDGSNGGWWDNIDYEPTCDDKACGDGELPDGYNLTIGKGISEECIVNYDCTEDELAALRKFSSKNPTGISMETPKDCPDGFIPVPGSILYKQQGFCVMKYEAKNVDEDVVSQPNGLPIVDVTYDEASTLASQSCDGCRLMTNNEWMTLARNIINQKDNWVSGNVGQGQLYFGNKTFGQTLSASSNDNDGYYGLPLGYNLADKRTLKLKNGEIIWDLSGNVREIIEPSCKGSGPPFIRKDGEWTAPSVWDALSTGSSTILPNSFPSSMGIDGVSDFSSGAQGLGIYVSDDLMTCELDFIRGGYFLDEATGGLLSLYLSDPSSRHDYIKYTIGFRAVR